VNEALIIMRPVVALIAAPITLFMAILLMASCAHKLFDFKRARDSAELFAGVPPSMAGAAAGAISIVELIAGALLVIPAQRMVGAALAAAVWTEYGFLMIRAISQGRSAVDCGCSFGSGHTELGLFQIVRNGVLVTLAAVSAAGPSVGWDASLISWQIMEALTLLALYGALDQVMNLKPLRSGVMS
jgi:uncharacterized membrane protein YphA (DoxX/SURF4 family)